MRNTSLTLLAFIFVMYVSGSSTWGQTLKTRPMEPQHRSTDNPIQLLTSAPLLTVPMSISAGTPINVALESEVRVHEVGQIVHAKTTEPVYAFDKLLIPAGTAVNGKIAAIDSVPKVVRVQNALNGNFTPLHTVHL